MNESIDAKTEATKETFWSLVSRHQYRIGIPRIQRDYAQGREEPEPKQIRNCFLKDAFHALSANVPMDINFIYGNIDNGTFVPIDGQQRLTTLFLLHWYFGNYGRLLTDEQRTTLSRFQYETRFVAGDFCKRLVEDVRIDLKSAADEGKNLRSIISDYYWFFSTYENDATIKGMLVMLDTVHEMVMQAEDRKAFDHFFERLTAEDCPISFLFLDIADLGLTDEIYIKMNARGKALTRYENFKAQLSNYLAQTDKDFSARFIGKLNGVWSQFFWHSEYRPDVKSARGSAETEKAIVFDDQIMNLFRFAMHNEYMVNAVIEIPNWESKFAIRAVMNPLVRENDFEFFNHLFADEFRTIGEFTADQPMVDSRVFRSIERLLDVLARRKEETGKLQFANWSKYGKELFDEENYFRRLIRSVPEKELSYEDQLLLYAEFCFLAEFSGENGEFDRAEELTAFLRYIYNLANNTPYNTIDDYYRSVKRIRILVDSGAALDILNYASLHIERASKLGGGFGFIDYQVKEESMKAILMLADPKWYELILDAEKTYLGSQISALLTFSGVWRAYEVEVNRYAEKHPEGDRMASSEYKDNFAKMGIERREIFDSYLRKFKLIFNPDGVKPELEKDATFRRALLTYGGEDAYMLPPKKPVCCFLDSSRDETSFHRLFRDDNKGCRNLFKQLLDDLTEDEPIFEQLRRIIAAACFDGNARWKRYFVEMPEIMNYNYQSKIHSPDGGYVFRNPKKFICRRSPDQILLLEKTITTSTQREYYSYVLFLKAKKQGLAVGYKTESIEALDKYAFFTAKSGHEYRVLYKKRESEDFWDFAIRDGEETVFRGAMDEAIEYIRNQIA